MHRYRRVLESSWTTLSTPWSRLVKQRGDREAGELLRDELLKLLRSLLKLGSLSIIGDPSSPDTNIEYGSNDTTRRLRKMIRHEFKPLFEYLAARAERAPGDDAAEVYPQVFAEPKRRPDGPERPPEPLDRLLQDPQVAFGRMPALWREGVQLARQRVEMQREALLNHVARLAQKPDFVVQRDWAGSEKERLFPTAQSWDEQWYYGAPHGKRGVRTKQGS
jgi:hypothetical protein